MANRPPAEITRQSRQMTVGRIRLRRLVGGLASVAFVLATTVLAPIAYAACSEGGDLGGNSDCREQTGGGGASTIKHAEPNKPASSAGDSRAVAGGNMSTGGQG